jgi:lysine 2,3-aminomutase
VAVTPYFAALADSQDPQCPLRRQIVPSMAELELPKGGLVDPLDEQGQSPVRGLVHRYPDRALMLVSTECAAYCRFCTRGRLVGRPEEAFGSSDLAAQLQYLRDTPAIRDVIVSGGDPLLLSDRRLDELLSALRAIPSVEVIRLHTRVPVFLPMRVTEGLAEVLGRHRPVWVNVHVNHARELAVPARAALARLAAAGLPLGAQTVLLRGVNDSVEALEDLFRALMRLGVRPYHLYHCDPVLGAEGFRTPLRSGAEIMAALRGRMSGLGLPTYVLDREGGRGKVPVLLAPKNGDNSPQILWEI